MVAVPAAIPVRAPGAVGMVATDSFILLHVPATVLVSVMDEPAQTVAGPAGVGGAGCTDTILVVIQPFTDV